MVRLGNIEAYVAGDGPGAVVVLHEWDGLVPRIREVADRVAAAGFTAVALDLYDGESAEPGDDEAAARLQRRITADPDAAAKRVADVVDALHRRGHPKVATLGFCTGSSLSLLTSATYTIDATVAYYGIFEDRADQKIDNPVLIHLAEHEEYYPPAERFRDWFGGMSNITIHIYPGTRHAFFNGPPSHYNAGAAQLSWDRTVSFLSRHIAR